MRDRKPPSSCSKGACGVRPGECLTGRAILMALCPSFILCTDWHCELWALPTTDSANCSVLLTRVLLGAATALPGRHVRQPAPSPVLHLLSLASKLCCRTVVCVTASRPPVRRVLRTAQLLGTAPAERGTARWRPLITAGRPAQLPVPSPNSTTLASGPHNRANLRTSVLLARQFVSGGYRLTASTRETLATPPSNVYSSQHRFFGV